MMSEEIGFPPPNMDAITPEKCNGRRHSMGQTCLSMDGKKKVPHYLRASTGSCHDLCKYGKRQECETKPWSSASRREKVGGKPPEKIITTDVVSVDRKSYLKAKSKLSSDGKIRLLDSSSGAKQKVWTSKKGMLGVNEVKSKAASQFKSSPAPTCLSNPGKTFKGQVLLPPFKVSKQASVKAAERETLAISTTTLQIKAAITKPTSSSKSPQSLGLRKYRDVVQNTRITNRIRVKDAIISSTSSIPWKSSVGSVQALMKGQVQRQKTVIGQRNEKTPEERGIQQIEEEVPEKTLYVVDMENYEQIMTFDESNIDVEARSPSQLLSNSEFSSQHNSSAFFSCSEERAEMDKSCVHSFEREETENLHVPSEEREETENSHVPSEERDEIGKSYIHSEEKEETENSHVHSEERDETGKSHVHSEEREETEKSQIHSEEREETEKSHVHSEQREETDKCHVHSEEREEREKSHVHSEEREETEKSHVHSEEREETEKSHVHSEQREETEKSHVHSEEREETEKSHVHSEEREETDKCHVHSEQREETDKCHVHSEEREEMEKSHVHSEEREETEKSHVHSEEREETEKSHVHSEEWEETDEYHVHSEEREETEKSRVQSSSHEGDDNDDEEGDDKDDEEGDDNDDEEGDDNDDEEDVDFEDDRHGSEYLDDESEVCSNTELEENEKVEEDVVSRGNSVKRRPRKEWMVHPKGVDGDPVKLQFRRGRVVEIQSVDNAPRRLKFRRGRSLTENEATAGTQQRRSQKKRDIMVDNNDPSSEKHVLRHSSVQERKDAQGLFNNVIEETASKLVETRKSKVMALVGAFETVISLQDGKPSTTDEAN